MSEKVMPEQVDKKHKHKETYHKANIPKALREQVWIKYMGNKFNGKCTITWCKNTMSAFDFHVGHDIPESKGGSLEITNLRPICARCNLSMAANYTIEQWNQLEGSKRKWWYVFLCM